MFTELEVVSEIKFWHSNANTVFCSMFVLVQNGGPVRVISGAYTFKVSCANLISKHPVMCWSSLPVILLLLLD